MNYRALYSDGLDRTVAAQDWSEAHEKAAQAHSAKLFTVQPKVTHRECIRLIDNVEQRFHEILASSHQGQGEDRNAALRLLLNEIHTLRNDYWIECDHQGALSAPNQINLLSNKIFEAFE